MDLNMKVKIQQDTIKQLHDEKEILRRANEDLALELESERKAQKELLDATLKTKGFYEEKLVEMSKAQSEYERLTASMKQLMDNYKKEIMMLRGSLHGE